MPEISNLMSEARAHRVNYFAYRLQKTAKRRLQTDKRGLLVAEDRTRITMCREIFDFKGEFYGQIRFLVRAATSRRATDGGRHIVFNYL